MPIPIASPRIAVLRTAILAGDTHALAHFWLWVQVDGAPLVEPIAGDDESLLVTFLWRAEIPTNSVAVIRDWGGANRLSDHLQMQPLPDTDLWFASRRFRADTRLLYQISLNDPRVPWTIAADRATCASGWQVDPLNPNKHLVIRQDDERGSRDLYFSRLELPLAKVQQYVAEQPGVPKGAVECYRLSSAIFGNERRVWAYAPPEYDPSIAYPLLVMLDGKEYIDLIPTPTILDNLIAERKIPPLVAIFPDSLGWETRGKELTCNPQLIEFVMQELFPSIQLRFRITTDPALTAIGGSSLGGLAAAFLGLNMPARFGKVLSQTGAFGWAPADDPDHEWLVRQFVANPGLPLKFYMDVGNLEDDLPADGGPSQLAANRHLRDVLGDGGYRVHYAEYSGGHDSFNSQGTLADGLIVLFGETLDSMSLSSES